MKKWKVFIRELNENVAYWHSEYGSISKTIVTEWLNIVYEKI